MIFRPPRPRVTAPVPPPGSPPISVLPFGSGFVLTQGDKAVPLVMHEQDGAIRFAFAFEDAGEAPTLILSAEAAREAIARPGEELPLVLIPDASRAIVALLDSSGFQGAA